MFSDPPSYIDSQLVCSAPPSPPAASKLNITYFDDPMCAGSIANYTCIAGGMNAFQVKIVLIYFLRSIRYYKDKTRLSMFMLSRFVDNFTVFIAERD